MIPRTLVGWVFACLLTSCAPRSSDSTFPSRKVSMQRMDFVRSGGFGGPAMRVAGTVTFDGQAGQVTSPGTDYKRALPPQEVEVLLTLADASSLDQATKKMPTSGPVRDGYQYQVTTAKDGITHSLIFPSDVSEDQVSQAYPAISPLLDWVKKECQTIFEYKI